MKIKTILIAGVLPLALFAKDDDVVGKIVPRLVESRNTELNQPFDGINEFAPEAESPSVGKFFINESNFVHKKSKARKSKVSTPAKVNKTDKVAVKPVLESANQDSIDSINQDSLETEEAVREYAEADADIKATTDSASTGAPEKLFVLDMTTSIIPTQSRRIAGHYGPRKHRMHRGVDLGLCHGEDRTIVAAFAGKVVKVRNQGRRKGYGRYVILDHGNGLTTLYAHLERWKVKVGDELQAGDVIGIGGNSGRSFGAHLHFEMRYNGIYINPETVYDFAEGTFKDISVTLDTDKLQEIEAAYQKEIGKSKFYKVRRGDCLGKIAHKYGTSVEHIKRLNNLKSDNIRPGQILRCS
ncbi:M23 family metallopeptidase [Fibrobacter sp. UBA4297]|uniref:M23 family metallopeptidase n=1 Tax=Fibrobacter sp. UBA4297 TaxID=1946536 RepID=UPI0025C721E8|nr:M23 family metallopeptidase [Fibrobacter sp. UBA4297]